MRIKDLKKIIEDEIKTLTKENGLVFNKKGFCFTFKNKGYTIDFNIFVDNYYGRGIEISSNCITTILLIKDFYTLNDIPISEYYITTGSGTQKLYDYFNKVSVKSNEKTVIAFNDDTIDNAIMYVGDFVPKLLFVLDSIKFELDNNLSKNFDSIDNQFLQIKLFDKLVLYHYFNPNKLPEALLYTKNIIERGDIAFETYQKYLIFIPKICTLNQLNYSDYQPKLPFFRRIKFYWQGIDIDN